MSKTNSSEVVHRDKLDTVLAVGDHVAFPSYNSLFIGVVIKLNKKTVKVKKIPSFKNGTWVTHKYSTDLLRIEDTALTFWLLKNAG